MRSPYLPRNEDRQWPGQSKDTSRLHRGDDGIDLIITISARKSQCEYPRTCPGATYRLASEGLPDDRTISNCVFRESGRWHDSSIANVHHVHHTDHEVVTGASAFLLIVQSMDQEFPHIRSKVGRMQGDDLGLFFEEEHRRGGRLPSSLRRIG